MDAPPLSLCRVRVHLPLWGSVSTLVTGGVRTEPGERTGGRGSRRECLVCDPMGRSLTSSPQRCAFLPSILTLEGFWTLPFLEISSSFLSSIIFSSSLDRVSGRSPFSHSEDPPGP